MRVDPGTVSDGYAQVTRGVNRGFLPRDLPRDQFSWASNAVFSNNVPQTRPGWIKRPLTFYNSAGATDANLKTNFEDYIYQGAIGFERKNQIIASIGGRLFMIRPDYWDVQDVTPAGSSANASLYRAWFAEAEDFVVRQDGQSAAWIFDGASARVADSLGIYGKKEVPVGTAMRYSQGRLIVTLPDRRSFVIGDIVGSKDSGTPQYNYRDSVLRFTENDYLNEGGAFAVPINAGSINAICPVAQVDTSTGQGPTQIFTDRAIFSLNTPTDRASWKSLTYPIQTFSALQSGSTSDRATVIVNGDIWMRAEDGVRSFVVARRDFGSWVNAPQSAEVDFLLDNDDSSLLEYCSASLFNGRLITTLKPYRMFQHGVVHSGFTVLDFTPVSYLGLQSSPVWEGVWSGLRILQIFTAMFNGVERCFIFALSADNRIELWEMTAYAINDNDGTADIPIQGFVETSSFRFPDAGFEMKKLSKGWLWVDDIQGTVVLGASYRANEDPRWIPWGVDWSICANTTTCGTTGSCNVPRNTRPQYRRPYLLPTPDGNCDSETSVPDNIGETFQVRIDFTGHIQLPKLLVVAQKEEQDVNAICPGDEACLTEEYCEDNGVDSYLINP